MAFALGGEEAKVTTEPGTVKVTEASGLNPALGSCPGCGRCNVCGRPYRWQPEWVAPYRNPYSPPVITC